MKSMKLRRNKVRVFFNSIVVKEEYSIQGETQIDYGDYGRVPGYSQEVHFDIIELEEGEKENLIIDEPKEKKFDCPFCGKMFRNSSNLKEHIVMHTKERNFHCPICFKSFRHKSNMRRHAKSHNQFSDSCRICRKVFYNSENLKAHLKRHDEKRYECIFCRQRFHYKCHLTHHMERQHSKTKIAAQNRKILTSDYRIVDRKME